jgi:hypothetical protein
MTHDPLCVWAQDAPTSANCYVIEGSEPPITTCEVIANVRENERAKCIDAVAALGPVSKFQTWIAGDGSLAGGNVPLDLVAHLRDLQ